MRLSEEISWVKYTLGRSPVGVSPPAEAAGLVVDEELHPYAVPIIAAAPRPTPVRIKLRLSNVFGFVPICIVLIMLRVIFNWSANLVIINNNTYFNFIKTKKRR